MVERTEKETLEFDLSPDKKKIAQKNCHVGIRRPTAYKFAKKERKANATKGGLIEEMARLIVENSNFVIENFQIPNKEGKISFKIGEKWYTFALTEHRTKPKWCNGD